MPEPDTEPCVSTLVINDPSDYPASDAAIIGTSEIPSSLNIQDDVARSGAGIGNVDYDYNSDHLFASNLEDGKIYSIDEDACVITDIFDPFGAYDPSSDIGIVEQAERIWGVHVSDCGPDVRLFFAPESTSGSLVKAKEVWSVGLNPDGTFKKDDVQQEFLVVMGQQSKFTDISISQDCNKLLLSERGHPHKASVLEYEKVGGDWFFIRQYFVGIYDLDAPAQPQGNILGTSTAGGVSYAPVEEGCIIDNQCDGLVYSTVNCGEISADDNRCSIYGAQGMSPETNADTTNKDTDIFISFSEPSDMTLPELFKSGIGDIEIYNCCCPGFEQRDTVNEVRRSIAGEVTSVTENPIPNVAVSLTSDYPQRSVMTDQNGKYLFPNLDSKEDYMIIPELVDNPLDGISTLDMLLIQRHILGLRKFRENANYIAADVNGSGTITANDLVELRRLILGYTDGFANNSTWNLLPTKILNETDPQLINESVEKYIQLTNLVDHSMENNFTAVKTGDINLDNSVESLVLPRSLNDIGLTYQITEPSKASGLTTVTVYSDTDLDLTGFQMALELNSNVVGIESDVLDLQPNHYKIDESQVKLSWHQLSSIHIDSRKPLMKIFVENFTNQIGLASEIMNTEMYDDSLLPHDVTLSRADDVQLTESLRVIQNPVTDVAMIMFEVSKDSPTRVEILSIDGKLIYAQEQFLNKGPQQMRISKEMITGTGSGIFLVKVTSEESTKTTQFILVD